MSTSLVLVSSELPTVADPVRAFVAAGHADATRRAYRSDWASFVAWAATHRVPSQPATPASLSRYLAELAMSGRKPSTINRALAAISQAHVAAGFPSPRGSALVRAALRGIHRTLSVALSQKAPVTVSDLRCMVEALPRTTKGIRDRALLLAGFAGGFRRSELVGLGVSDVVFGDDGAIVTLRRSKTDQEGAGRKVGIPFGSNPATCPVRSLKSWLALLPSPEGPLFRSVTRAGIITSHPLSPIDVARVVKAAASSVGLDASLFAGHSLRAGLCTSAARAGKSERAIMTQTGHRSVAMMRRYIRDANLFADNAAAGIGL